MKAYEITINRLYEKGYAKVDYKDLDEEFGISCFRKEHIFVVLQNWDYGITIDDIKEETLRLRNALHQKRVNVWNSYYLLCVDGQRVDDEMIFFIERESTGIRKYVIRNEDDLSRIPFLDNTPVRKIENPIQFNENINNYGEIVKKLFEYLKEQNGDNEKLDNKKIEQALSYIFDKKGDVS
jgi:hypothetical protein